MRICTIFRTKQNSPFVLNKNFLVLYHCYYFHLPIGPFHCAKFLQRIQNYDSAPFLDPNWFIYHKPIFFRKLLLYSHLPISPSHCAKVRNVQFLGPKWPISPNNNFFRKPFHEPCFFYSCLSICQKSKLDINLLVKY